MSPDYLMMLEAAAEPRLDGFDLVGSPTIKRSVDEQGRDIVFNMEVKGSNSVQAPVLAPQPVFLPGGGGAHWTRQYVILHFKPGKEPSHALAELRGSYTAQVKTPVEVLTIDKALGFAGKTLERQIRRSSPSGRDSICRTSRPLHGSIHLVFATSPIR